MFDKWMELVKKKYKVDIEHSKGDNHFISDMYTFSDPNSLGLSFTIMLNEDGIPSVFDTPRFRFKHFNVAEYVNSEDILLAAEACLEGNLIIKQGIWGKQRLEFELSSFHGISVSAKIKFKNLPHAYEQKDGDVRP